MSSARVRTLYGGGLAATTSHANDVSVRVLSLHIEYRLDMTTGPDSHI